MRIKIDEEMRILISPHPKCETIDLHFRQWKEVKAVQGWDLCKESMLEFERKLRDVDYVCASFTKTQYAGFSVHVAVAELLRAVASRCSLAYVSDEADYYETGDSRRARSNFDESTEMLKAVSAQLKKIFGEDKVVAAIDNVNAEGG